MPSLLTKLLGALSAIAAGLAFFYRGRAKSAQNEAQHQAERADHAVATADSRRRADEAVTQVKQQHREELQDAQTTLDAGRRDHLNGDW